MSDRHVVTSPSPTEIASEIGALPTSVEAFQAALQAERQRLAVELNAQWHAQIALERQALEAEFKTRLETEVHARFECPPVCRISCW